MKKVLPIIEYEDFYVNIAKKDTLTRERRTDIIRRALPKIDSLMEWKIVKTGDILSIQQWLKEVFGWSAVETYAFSIDKKTGKTLSELRKEYMEQMEQNAESSDL